MITEISKDALIAVFKGITPTFSETSKALVPAESEIVQIFFKNGEQTITINDLLATPTEQSPYLHAIKFRIAAVILLLQDFHETSVALKDSTKQIWELIFQSLDKLNGTDILATIGSQGFLSIPLFHQDKKDESFEFLRLHIWDKSFEEFIDWEKTEKFSIHSHQFHAQSRILLGEIENWQFNVEDSVTPTDNSYFRIEWNNLENVNQKTSNAVNSGRFAKLKLTEQKTYKKEDAYEVQAGQFHKSKVDMNNTTATIFLFSSIKGKVDQSFVLGPSAIETSTVNRKITIDPKSILDQLNQQIS